MSNEKNAVIAVATEDGSGLDSQVCQHFGGTPYFTLVEVRDGAIASHRVAPNPHLSNHIPGVMPKLVRDLGASAVLTGGMGGRAISMMERFGIEVATGAQGGVREAVLQYLAGSLEGVSPCTDHLGLCGDEGHHHH